jgi:hypothetical protein
MSRVTNAILHTGCVEPDEEKRLLARVNDFFYDGMGGFVSVEDESLPDDWYIRGGKALECSLAIGAFNYLQLPKLIEHLRRIEWEQPEAVQLIVKEQDDDRFRVINVFE